jgi:glycine cleavage system H protein
MYPADYRYTKQHEWVKVDGDTGTVGITDYAQQEFGDVVFVDIPKIGATLKAGESFGTVESVKAVSEIYCPGFRRNDCPQRSACPGMLPKKSIRIRTARPGW